MTGPVRILVLGASYGLLPGVKLALAGHHVTFVGQEQEVARMVASDLVVRIPQRRSDNVTQLRCASASFATPATADPEAADFIILAMQEPQFAHPAVAELTRRIGRSGKPCLSIMNLPPPPFLRRLGMDESVLAGAYSSASAWEGFDPQAISNASPDPQALRMNPDAPGELTVTLASNFKAAPFAREADQHLLEMLARDMSRLKVDGIAPPVRLLAHSSPFIPLAKWPMLIAGNCRCIEADGIRTIAEAVLSDAEHSRAVYEVVLQAMVALGADPAVMVPFDAYAKAAVELVRPSSAARAIANGAQNIERIDKLVLQLMQANGLDTALVEPVVGMIEQRLTANRAA